jgi:hypothetical protein
VLALLTACGGGGGDGAVTADPLVPDNNDDPQSSLSTLFGRSVFVFSFFGEESREFYDGVYEPSDLDSVSFSKPTLVATFDALRRETPESNIEQLNSLPMFCSLFEEVDAFNCTVVFANGGSDHFWFDVPVDNQSFGSFEYCPSELSATQCVDELFNTPDGAVLVTVTPEAIASAIDLAELDEAKKSPTGISVVPYREYSNQGTSKITANRSPKSLENLEPLLNILEEHRSFAKSLNID